MSSIIHLLDKHCDQCRAEFEEFNRKRGRNEALNDFMKACGTGQRDFIFTWYGDQYKLHCEIVSMEDEVNHGQYTERN